MVFIRTWPLKPNFLYTVMANTPVQFRCNVDFVHDIRRTFIVHIHSDPFHDFNHDFPVWPRVPNWLDYLMYHLHSSICVCIGSIPFQKACCWQYNVCILSGFSQEYVLDHQEGYLFKTMHCMGLVRIRKDRVFTDNVSSLHDSLIYKVEHLYDIVTS